MAQFDNQKSIDRMRSLLAQAYTRNRRAQTDGGRNAKRIIGEASSQYPEEWVAATDSFGSLFTAMNNSGRAFQVTFGGNLPNKPGVYKVRGAPKGRRFNEGDGYIETPDNLTVSVHEYAHRVQHALPELDEVFQKVHRRRTAGDSLVRLRDLQPRSGYEADEVTKPDDYVDPYFGKEYGDQGALEMMTMVYEAILGDSYDNAVALAARDPELMEIGIGLLLKWRP